MTDDHPAKSGSDLGRTLWGAAAIFGVLIAATAGVALYEKGQLPGKNVAVHIGECARSLDLAQAIDPFVHGEMAALAAATEPHPLDQTAFDDASGTRTTVAAFKNRTILLNIWATWCIPCRAEMPSLDKLQAALGSGDFAVVPVNIDTARLEKPKAFLKEIGATSLPFYSDKTADIMQVLRGREKVVGLPTTILIGADGCEIATMAGPAHWDSPEARALIERLKKPDAATRHPA